MLGENLGIEVVAEGIETERQLELLLSLGCRHGQGFLFSQPIGAGAAEKLLHGKSNTLFSASANVAFTEQRDVLQVPAVH